AAEALAAGISPAAMRPTTVVIVYVALLSVANEVVGLPLTFFGGFLVERRYGLSNQALGGWLLDELKGFVLAVLLAALAATVVYFFIRRAPDSWWLPAGAMFALLIV